MKKKELLQMNTLPANRDILDAVYTDRDVMKTMKYGWGTEKQCKTCRYFLYFRAEVEKDILKVFLYSRTWLYRLNREPQYIIYIDKKADEFITFSNADKKWKTAKIDMLDIDTHGYEMRYNMENYQTQETRNIVNEYLGTGNLEVRKAVLDFQCDARKETLKRKHKRETDEIDEVMNEIPELPEDFDNWIIENCFKEYMFFKPERKKKRKTLCSHCGTWSIVEEPKHGNVAVCLNCKANAVYRSWNKQKYVTNEVEVTILQKLRDQTKYVVRKFWCKLKRCHEKGWQNSEFYKSETLRTTLSDDFRAERTYSYGEYKNTGINRWCYAVAGSSWYGYYTPYLGSARVYTPNLSEVLKNTSFVNMNLKEVFGREGKKDMDVIRVLRVLNEHPYLEYFEKSGLTTLVEEVLEGRAKDELFNSKGKRVHEVLRLDKQRFQRLKKINGGRFALAALQYEYWTEDKVTDEHLKYIELKQIDIENLELERTHMSLQKTLNFLKRQKEILGIGFGEVKQYYKDYLDMAAERGMDITDEIVCKNARMMEYHNRYLEEKNQTKNQKRDAEVNKKFQEIRNRFQTNAEHFAWENDAFVILVPRQASDITEEGRLQHHCVGASDNYMRKMNSGTSFILFLRHKEDVGIPYYTLEVGWDASIIQAYAAYDRKPDYAELVEPMLKEFQKIVQKRMLKESMKEVEDDRLQDNVQLLSAAG